MRHRLLGLLLVAGGCARSGGETPPRSGPSQVSASPAAAAPLAPASPAVAPAPAPVCEQNTRGLLVAIRTGRVPMSARPYNDAVAAWRDVAAACRDGNWYLAGALMHRDMGAADARDAGLADVADALTKGLAAAANDSGLLAYDAFLAGVAPGTAPDLPVDACERAKAEPPISEPRFEAIAQADRIAYVCGHAALRAGRAADAVAAFAGMHNFPYPDAPIRHIEALKRDGKAPGSLAKDAKRAISLSQPPGGVTTSDLEILRKQLAAALK